MKLNALKTNVFSALIVGCLALTFAVPALAASSNYSFTLSNRVVNGDTNKQHHSLSKGNATLKGTHYVYSSKDGAVGPNTIHYTLYNKTTGNNFGDIIATPTKDGKNSAVSGTYKGLGGGTTYYLLIWRTADDGRTIKGAGTVSN